MFDDIRPYADDEVRPVLTRLVRDPELLKAARAVIFPRASQRWAAVLNPLIVAYLRWQTRSVSTVDGVQQIMEKYLLRVLDSSTTGFSVSGLETLPRDRACLFVGNHRDIALDPAFVSYALQGSGLNTCRVAIGDNLLTKLWVADLMRLNKCFVVHRSASGPRQLLKRYRQLSKFIGHSVLEEGESVWIAQREGRAKNGNDRTDAAILKMLYMEGKRQGLEMNEYFNRLTVVPVSISYELDPCDGMKAKELHATENQGDYTKAEHEDIISIAHGVRGQKGCVHVAFSAPLDLIGDEAATPLTAERVAQCIDEQIHSQYRLHPSNVSAYKLLQGSTYNSLETDEALGVPGSEKLLEQKASEFQQRLQASPAEHQQKIVEMYATPVSNKLAVLKSA